MKDNDLERMLSQHGRQLDLVYDEIGDYFDAVDWVPANVLSGLRILVERVQMETDGTPLESLLSALIKAVSRGKPLPPEIFEPIVSTSRGFQLIYSGMHSRYSHKPTTVPSSRRFANTSRIPPRVCEKRRKRRWSSGHRSTRAGRPVLSVEHEAEGRAGAPSVGELHLSDRRRRVPRRPECPAAATVGDCT